MNCCGIFCGGSLVLSTCPYWYQHTRFWMSLSFVEVSADSIDGICREVFEWFVARIIRCCCWGIFICVWLRCGVWGMSVAIYSDCVWNSVFINGECIWLDAYYVRRFPCLWLVFVILFLGNGFCNDIQSGAEWWLVYEDITVSRKDAHVLNPAVIIVFVEPMWLTNVGVSFGL